MTMLKIKVIDVNNNYSSWNIVIEMIIYKHLITIIKLHYIKQIKLLTKEILK